MLIDDRKLTTEFVKGVFSRHSRTWNGADFDNWLAAVEAAVRADQIEKDAVIVCTLESESPNGGMVQYAPIVSAIRAQLGGTTDE